MANNIIANTGQITAKADELKSFNADLKGKISDLRSQENSLGRMWEGDAKEEFHRAFENDAKQMDEFYKLIEKYVESLKQIVKAYEEAERANAQRACERKYK